MSKTDIMRWALCLHDILLSDCPKCRRTEPPWLDLDDGIRETVRAVWDMGFAPTDSGDGERQGVKADWGDEALPVPHVFIASAADTLIADTRRLHGHVVAWSAAGRFVPPEVGPCIQASYDPDDGSAIIELYGAIR